MDDGLDEIREQLNRGRKLSMQSSYARRAPNAAALPFLNSVRTDLIRHIENNEPTEEVWRLLACAEECLLRYCAAIRCLERAMTISGKRDKKDLKKLILLREYDKEWKDLSLSPMELEKLGEFLEKMRIAGAFERNFRYTKQWLMEFKPDLAGSTIEALERRGAYNDFQVLANVV